MFDLYKLTNILFDENSEIGDWIFIEEWKNLPSTLSSYTEIAQIAIRYIYWGCVVFGVFFASFKFINSIRNYFANADNPQLASQYKADIMEIIMGFMWFSVGIIVIGLISNFLFDFNFFDFFGGLKF